ncbi:MAG: hypothetical protein ABWY68_12195 [Cryobacterium sp.]
MHAGLSPAALALTGLSLRAEGDRHVIVVLSELNPDAIFAGVHTALDAAHRLADALRLPLRVVVLAESSTWRADSRRSESTLASRFGRPVRVVSRHELGDTSFHRDDIWVVTHWTTAHAAQVGTIDGSITSTNVVYLIQDFEPGFNALSTEFTTASGTFDAGFLPVVNSLPLAGYLKQHTRLPLDDDLVFAPAFDPARLEQIAAARRTGPVTVLFYGRPSKPRNLYGLGLAALREATLLLGDGARSVRFVSAGESHGDVELGPGVQLTSLGTLGWDAYFSLLAEANVVLSLQASPHPSHPPLEAAVSGAHSVTNEIDDARAHLHERLRAAPATPTELGAALADAITRAATQGPGPFRPIDPALLGAPLETVIALVAERLGA